MYLPLYGGVSFTYYDFREPTPKDIALNGLTLGRSLPLEIVPIEGKGDGVVARAPIAKGSFVTDYKYAIMHKSRQAFLRAERDYIDNEEGCYIMECVVNGKKVYLDATRRLNSYGRYDDQ